MFAWFVLILLGAIWGASYLFIKIGVAEIPPFTFVFLRTTIAAVALLIALRILREPIPKGRRMWLIFLAMGITNGVIPYTLITWGEQHITSGLAAILTAAMPLFTILLAHFWTQDERLTNGKVLGIAIGFMGVVALFLPELRQGVQMEVWGELAVVGAAASYGTATLIARKCLDGVSHVAAAAGQLGTAALCMVPLSLVFDNPTSLRPSFLAIGSLVILALLGTSFAYVLYYWLVEHTGATRTALVTYLIPITGILWGAVLLSEPLEWESLIGLALVIGGVALVTREGKPKESSMMAVPAEGE